MQKLKYYDRQLLSAFALGLLALAFNSLSITLLPNAPTSLGNFFLFCSAIALGPWKAFVSLVVSIIPEVIYREMVFHSGVIYGIRVAILVMILGYVAQRRRDLLRYDLYRRVEPIRFQPYIAILREGLTPYLWQYGVIWRMHKDKALR